MIAFFLTISIFLNILCLLAIVILFQKQHRLHGLEMKQQHALQEMEDILTSFLYEIKEENEQLQVLLENNQQPLKRNEEVSSPKPTAPVIVKEQAGVDVPGPTLSKNSIQLRQVRKVYNEQEVSWEKYEELPPWLKLEDELDQSETAAPKDQIISLWNEGHTIEAIAKKINKGKTEVELTLKFYGIL
ncbi:MAG TPA: hypothetical protein VNM69_19110 [Bacillus sp. (in: firmicutes)]|nr:hypothetical protein [Bacillus sp. (in: firmicutes)]